MIDPNIVRQITQAFFSSLPPTLQAMNQDLRSHLETQLRNCLTKLELITREEFNIQTKVLAKTREKVEQLERLIEKSE